MFFSINIQIWCQARTKHTSPGVNPPQLNFTRNLNQMFPLDSLLVFAGNPQLEIQCLKSERSVSPNCPKTKCLDFRHCLKLGQNSSDFGQLRLTELVRFSDVSLLAQFQTVQYVFVQRPKSEQFRSDFGHFLMSEIWRKTFRFRTFLN